MARELIVLCGLPFSGKTTLAKELMNDDALLMERDRFLEDVKTSESTKAMLKLVMKSIKTPVTVYFATHEQNAWNDALTSLYVTRVSDGLAKTTEGRVIIDGTHLHPLSRRFILDLQGFDKYAVALPADVATSVTRLNAANANLEGLRQTVTPEMIERMARAYVLPTVEEGFDAVFTSPVAALARFKPSEPTEPATPAL